MKNFSHCYEAREGLQVESLGRDWLEDGNEGCTVQSSPPWGSCSGSLPLCILEARLLLSGLAGIRALAVASF